MAALRFLTLSQPSIRMLLLYFFFSSISRAANSYASQFDFHYTNCRRPFVCGQQPKRSINATYPFWGNGRPHYCGREGFELRCRDNEYASLDFDDQEYKVLEIDQTNRVLTVARDDLWKSLCLSELFQNTTMDTSTLFCYPTGVTNLSILYCPDPNNSLVILYDEITCPLKGYPNRIALLIKDEVLARELADHPELNNCSIRMKVPVLQSALDKHRQGQNDWQDIVNRGFELAYGVEDVCSACESSGGTCGTSSSSPHKFTCYCPDKAYPSTCNDTGMRTQLSICCHSFLLFSCYVKPFNNRIIIHGRKKSYLHRSIGA